MNNIVRWRSIKVTIKPPEDSPSHDPFIRTFDVYASKQDAPAIAIRHAITSVRGTPMRAECVL